MVFVVLIETFCAGASAEGLTVRLVVSDDSTFASETASHLQNLLEQSIDGIELERVGDKFLPASTSRASAHLVVTLGDAAWQRAVATSSQDSLVLAVMPHRFAYETSIRRSPRNSSAIFLEQPVGRMLNLVSLLRPRDAHIGVVLGPTTQEMSSRLQEASSERRQRLRLETVSEEAAVGQALARMIQNVNILLAIPDPVVHTANTVQSILLMSYHAGIPLIGYSAAYQRSGAMVSLYTTPEQLARQAAEAVIAWHRGKGLPSTRETKYFTVGINATVARSLGVELPDTDTLEQKLRSMKE
ncbi:MAG: hypothetical protein WAO76_18690 [Georgfuchsia sp.]